jgi:hypothetical protein
MKALRNCGLALGVLLVLAGVPGWAAPNEKAADVNFAFLTKLPEGKMLEAGRYRITLVNETATPEVAFYKDGKLLCKCPVKLENVEKTVSRTQVAYEKAADNSQLLTSILVRGWTQKIVFPSPAAAGPGR